MVTYYVLRCCKCEIFQIQQQKKTGKWFCVTCGTKQSTIKIYAESQSSADLRRVVQDFNMTRGLMEEEKGRRALASSTAGSAPSASKVAEQPSTSYLVSSSSSSTPTKLSTSQNGAQPPAQQSSVKCAPPAQHIVSFPSVNSSRAEREASLPILNPASLPHYPNSVKQDPNPSAQPSNASPSFVSPFSFAVGMQDPLSSSIVSSRVEIVDEAKR